MFQSTHPCGVRPARKVFGCLSPGVSIHAPLRGATLGLPTAVPNCRSFNPRTPAGCDISPWLWSAVPRFQSTHPCGCDRETIWRWETGGVSSTHLRCDHWSRVLGIGAVRFNPRTAGATAGTGRTGSPPCCFNPRTPAGATHRGCPLPVPTVFNPRTLRVRQLVKGGQQAFNVVSIHAPCGCDLVSSAKGSSHTCFNPRTLRGATEEVQPRVLRPGFQSTHFAGATEEAESDD